MPRAVWNGVVLAESDRCLEVEGNCYFPADSLNREYFQESTSHTLCMWKGIASYYNVKVHGQVNVNAAWYYPKPWPLGWKIRDHVSFWHGVRIEQ